MQRTPTPHSTNVASWGYDLATKTLEVEFNGGAVYRYKNVPPETASAFGNAGSKGKFLNQKIKGVYEFTKLDPEEK